MKSITFAVSFTDRWLVYGEVCLPASGFHIHIDCIRLDVNDAIAIYLERINDPWKSFSASLLGHTYIPRRLAQPDLTGVNPFAHLLQSSPAAAGNVTRASFYGKPSGRVGRYVCPDHPAPLDDLTSVDFDGTVMQSAQTAGVLRHIVDRKHR
jgi:hypothetical protein